MFEKIGYEDYCSKDNYWLRYRKMLGQGHTDIVFRTKEKRIYITKEYFKPKEIYAVYQQCKELGWLESEKE